MAPGRIAVHVDRRVTRETWVTGKESRLVRRLLKKWLTKEHQSILCSVFGLCPCFRDQPLPRKSHHWPWQMNSWSSATRLCPQKHHARRKTVRSLLLPFNRFLFSSYIWSTKCAVRIASNRPHRLPLVLRQSKDAPVASSECLLDSMKQTGPFMRASLHPRRPASDSKWRSELKKCPATACPTSHAWMTSVTRGARVRL